MHHEKHTDFVEVVSNIKPGSLSSKTKGILAAMMVIGFGTFIYHAILGAQPRIAWISFLHNLYFFTGIAAGGVLVAAILQVTNANWGRPIKRFAESAGAFLPFALIGLVILYFGADKVYVWVTEPPHTPHKHFWLNREFLFFRDFVALGILTLVAYRFMKASVRPDLGLASETNPSNYSKPEGWEGLEQEVEKSYKSMGKLGAAYCLLFAVIISLLAYDLIMSLDPYWISGMFGGWNFTTVMMTGWISIYFMAHFMGNKFGLQKYMNKLLYHDAGKLAFGFTVVWGYLFFSQYMVIWYGNLPQEAGYVLTRLAAPWDKLSYIAFLLVFLLPFIFGLGKDRKMSFKSYLPVILVSLAGVWLERFLLIAPSSWYYDRANDTFKVGIPTLLVSDLLVFIGFLGLFLFVYAGYLYKKPVMVIADPKLAEGINRH